MKMQENKTGKAGMTWYRVVVNGLLFLMAIAQLCNAYGLFSGVRYGENLELVKEVFPAVRVIDLVYAVICCLIAAAAVLVRNRLKGFRKGAPKLFLWLLGITLAVTILYTVGVSAATGEWMCSLYTYMVWAGEALLLGWNIVYFRGRADLFNK